MNPEDIPLRDLHLPEVIGWWPLAPGWWALSILLVIGLVLLARRGLRSYRQNAARRAALARLKVLQAEFALSRDAASLGVQLSALLRRVMLAYAPRDEVAGLTGSDWLAWLDRGLPEAVFTRGPGRHIASLPYRKPGLDTSKTDIDGLIRAVRLRLEIPLPEAA
ncbi:MAG: DUF4381 domain-containing protein [Gammaproteobacteria bacterium]